VRGKKKKKEKGGGEGGRGGNGKRYTLHNFYFVYGSFIMLFNKDYLEHHKEGERKGKKERKRAGVGSFSSLLRLLNLHLTGNLFLSRIRSAHGLDRSLGQNV